MNTVSGSKEGLRLKQYFKYNNLLSEITKVKEDLPDLETKRIKLLGDLYTLHEKSGWLIGELLIQQRKILKDRYQDWQQYQRENGGNGESYTQIKSIYDWAEANKDELGFGERTARRYIRLREETTPEIGNQLGIKKAEIIKKAPKPIQQELRKMAVKENWSTPKVEQVVNIVKNKKSKNVSIKDIDFDNVIKANLPKISVKLHPRNKSQIIIEVAPKYRDSLNNLLQERYIPKLKHSLHLSMHSH